MTRIFFDKRGKISVIKTSLFFMGLGLLIIISSVVYVSVESESARSPLYIDVPPNAETWGISAYEGRPYQKSFFKVPNTDVDSVAQHYQEQAGRFGSEPCKRLPPNGNFPDYDPNDATLIPFKWQCIFERSNIPGAYQLTEVVIYPGTFASDDPFTNTLGYTIVQYEQSWNG